MDGDWDEVARIPFPPPGLRALPTPVTTLAFDTSQELLWTGNEYGRVSSFYGSKLQQYTSFKAHASPGGPVRQLLFNDKGVIALGSRGVHMALRRGVPLWSIRHEDMQELRCMSFTSKGTAEILVAGEHDKMFVIDTNKGEITKQIPTEHRYKIMRRSRYICAATSSGAVHIIDSLNFQVIKVWNAHTAAINDMDAQHDFIVTCGYSMRHQGNYMPDPFVNVFDLKNMISMSPIPFPAGAAYVRMHPRMSTTSIVMSQIGQMHVVDLMNPNTSNVRQANSLSYFSMIEIASSGEAVALADGDCYIHLWGSPNKIHFSEFPTPIETADSTSATRIDFDTPETPLSTIGMPYYRDVLLSAWPSNMVTEVGAPPVKIDPQFLATLQERDWGYFGKNTRPLRRNQVEDTRGAESPQSSLKPPKFLSEKAREAAKSPAGTPAPEEIVRDTPQVLHDTKLESHKVEVPESYQNVEIKYSKFGIDDFDFGYFNKTQYSGLQNHIVNAYANPLLQVMHYTPLIRNVALQHAATACVNELCLLCELGFLFDMLHKAEGEACQASNFTKTLSYHSEAGKLGLLEEEPHSSRTVMLQQLTRFLLRQMAHYHALMTQNVQPFVETPNSGAFEELFQTSATSSIRCMNCRSETTKADPTMVNELMYPQNKPGHRNARVRGTTFSQVLKMSVERETANKGWCNNCRRYQTLATRKTIHRVPSVLILTTAINNNDHRRLWATPGWLPEEIGVIVDSGQFFCFEGEDLKLHLQRGIHSITVYTLTGLAVNIEGGQQQRSHLVAMANIAHSAPVAPGQSQWYLFNDFYVKPIPTQEALTFNTSWKTPSIIAYQVKSANNKLDSSWKQSLDSRFLYVDLQGDRPDKTYRTLDPRTEPAGPNTIVAIDTEFVKISQPEVEMHSDGDSKIIRPTVHALARNSIVRGSGMDEGVPFIDDYITIKEKVVDYLTSYSGITAEDLDETVAPQRGHNLVPLKIAYKKIWILLNLGCKFLGHGLKQDFRVINIHVPKAQVIDTSDLFFIKERLRKLSLQFLAHTLLKEDIQQVTHDSIEDARTALRLYRKYQEFNEAGILDAMLQEIYAKGAASNFKPPAKVGSGSGGNGNGNGNGNGGSVPRTDTPPADTAAPGPSTPSRKPAVAAVGSATPTSTPGRGSGSR
ncbi:PAB-dependent poly(A)-specific ribonuclease subunit PAN2 [Durotheca rogersii]|uniref:PAB-dependent poly(A)-specific ribonuclease subunit PAN2 n=1 Tax=Durotheca rogersii TaxID=419775 RepID=UPI00221F7894|nr:PAB-dependent poly(A)-specific ribonuclease subunit PAN2 [Durotheca rogersii]KAI5865927.1 PAB-dependent poly(A)-specific ribonuclease subunit PAN2 [Durotheca rogersii]